MSLVVLRLGGMVSLLCHSGAALEDVLLILCYDGAEQVATAAYAGAADIVGQQVAHGARDVCQIGGDDGVGGLGVGLIEFGL